MQLCDKARCPAPFCRHPAHVLDGVRGAAYQSVLAAEPSENTWLPTGPPCPTRPSSAVVNRPDIYSMLGNLCIAAKWVNAVASRQSLTHPSAAPCGIWYSAVRCAREHSLPSWCSEIPDMGMDKPGHNILSAGAELIDCTR